jgi:hypothetical protein
MDLPGLGCRLPITSSRAWMTFNRLLIAAGLGLKESLMKKLSTLILILAIGAAAVPAAAADFRPPAVPLVTHDPYFSIWSFSDRLTDDWPRHWTGTPRGLCGLARIDGQTFRWIGPAPRDIPAMEQKSLRVGATRTEYAFEAAGVRIDLAFTSPLLPHDLGVLSRPATYLTWEARSLDGREHAVSVYLDATLELGVNTPDQLVVWSRLMVGDLDVLSGGSKDQPVLGKSGDDLRVDWGYFYLAAEAAVPHMSSIQAADLLRSAFAKKGALPSSDDLRMPRPADDEYPALAVVFDLGKVGARPVERHVILAYDDQFSIEYFHRALRPYWREGGAGASNLLQQAAGQYANLLDRCRRFDGELAADLTAAGGEKYAALALLAYRQSLAAQKLAADIDGTPLLFPKENFSNGCIATVDVIYPAAPLLLLVNVELAKATLRPILEYSLLPRWKFPFAPHDLGTYPKADGQVYGGGEKTEEDQMPVEESGNMLILMDAVARMEGKPDFAVRYWPSLSKWAAYLKDKGLDPENQLCTDDFAGHLAHNVNLSLKAILALGGYADLCRMRGLKAEAAEYRRTAEAFVRKWVSMADDGDHDRLAFDKPGTWSQKYNLVWDRILGLDLFPPEAAEREVRFYLRHQNRYGLPLDSRRDYTKLDWTLWTASLASAPADFEALVAPVYAFADESPSRVPLTDWYDTVTGKKEGFQARSVVGGVFIKMLLRPDLWQKWSNPAGR